MEVGYSMRDTERFLAEMHINDRQESIYLLDKYLAKLQYTIKEMREITGEFVCDQDILEDDEEE